MFQPQTIDIVYVGSKKVKTDNVCGTGTVWFGYGDVQKVERKHAPKFMAHPDVWLTAEEFEKLKDSSNQKQGETKVVSIQSQTTGAAQLSGAVPDSLESGSTSTALAVSAPGLADAGNAGSIGDEGANTKTDESTKNTKTDDDLAVIKNAILSLEQGNTAHFSATNGIPIVSAVRNAAGNDAITAAEVRTAWAQLNGKDE